MVQFTIAFRINSVECSDCQFLPFTFASIHIFAQPPDILSPFRRKNQWIAIFIHELSFFTALLSRKVHPESIQAEQRIDLDLRDQHPRVFEMAVLLEIAAWIALAQRLIQDSDDLQRANPFLPLSVLDQHKVGAFCAIVSAKLFDAHARVARLNERLPFPLGKNLQIKQRARLLARVAREQDVVLAHHAAHHGDGSVLPGLPGKPVLFHDIEIEHAIHAVGLPALHKAERIAGEFHVVGVAHHDVQIRILGVVEIVHLAALHKERILLGFLPFARARLLLFALRRDALILAERGNIARLHVYHAVVAIALPQKLGHDFGRLPRLHELARDEARQFAILKPGGAG